MSTNGFFMPAYPLSALKQTALKWFDSRHPIIAQAGNYPEKLHRIKWLSEGSLTYHWSNGRSGELRSPEELTLFQEFIRSGPELKASWKPWCVEHRDGWCAIMQQHGPRDDKASSVETRCKHWVTLPFGYQRIKPTCPECLGLKL